MIDTLHLKVDFCFNSYSCTTTISKRRPAPGKKRQIHKLSHPRKTLSRVHDSYPLPMWIQSKVIWQRKMINANNLAWCFSISVRGYIWHRWDIRPVLGRRLIGRDLEMRWEIPGHVIGRFHFRFKFGLAFLWHSRTTHADRIDIRVGICWTMRTTGVASRRG